MKNEKTKKQGNKGVFSIFMREKIDNLFSLLDSALKRFMNQIQKRLFRMLLSLFLFIIALSFVLVGVVFLLSRIMPWDVALIVFGIALLAIGIIVSKSE
ncbi:hypothetical protein J4460_04340 [Candidatus Woesearchaeota archaeon]|nr:hypothetical protein [Candidatus Woesearchaeota archaeon]HIH38504.1 hypothetical protein [Candidatus Woesearchaeota archaeon]HIH48213.1 hypothetical protein [Candidatus Woesearchaeota archaeon]HIJ04462.1 hypothetical protein [Candidatus Woesearchaeota archaeon]